MLYTANPPQIGWTTVAQPLAGSKDGGPTVPRDVVTLMGEYYAQLGEHKGKLLLGVNSFPWPGYEFRARSAARLATILERGRTKPYAMLEQAALYGRRWGSRQQAFWYALIDVICQLFVPPNNDIRWPAPAAAPDTASPEHISQCPLAALVPRFSIELRHLPRSPYFAGGRAAAIK